MTCIIGFIDRKKKNVWIGGDSLGSNGYTKGVNKNPKVFHHHLLNNVIMGSTSTYRHIDLLQYSDLLFPEIEAYKNINIDRKYMVKNFIPNLINLFQNNVISQVENSRGGNFILGAGEKLFEIQSDYSVLEPSCGYCAVGCGEDVAMGSLYATSKNYPNWSAEKHILTALEAAEFNCCGVQRPFLIINSKNNQEILVE